MEVAALAKPVIVGPHTDNFAAPVAALRGADAIRVVTSTTELASAVRDLIEDEQSARQTGRRAQQVVKDNQGATDRTVDQLVRLLRTYPKTHVGPASSRSTTPTPKTAASPDRSQTEMRR